jgi:DNA polymerase (family X)
MTRYEIAKILEEIALLLEMKGENPFKSRAYQNAARTVESMEDDIDGMLQTGRLAAMKGIGDALQKKITELVTTGRLQYFEQLKASIPPGHFDMLKIPGLGPKKIRALYESLGIENIGELEYACHENRLVELKGFGKKTQDKILSGIESVKRYREKRLFVDALPEAQSILSALKSDRRILQVSLAGSLRRGNEVVKDVDILAATEDTAAVGLHFSSLPAVGSVTARGETKVSVVLKSGMNADLRIVSPTDFPYALHHFTGSREHNTAMRSRAKKLGMKINEYGLFQDDRRIVCRDEAELFRALGLQYIPPELREDMGEIEAAERNEIPRLLEIKDIRGMFHLHTSASDGADSLETLMRQALARGYEYIGISDHSQSAAYAGGLSVEAIERQHALIDELNEKAAPFRIFRGIESDILVDGRLDYEDQILSRFDFVIASVHSHFGLSEEAMTKRILAALAHPFTTILAHPTGRLLLAREPYALNLQRVVEFAAENEKILELNANPLRLDLDWRQLIPAKKKGVKIAINPDIHHLDGFNHMAIGVNIARKGWLSPADCINCLNVTGMEAMLNKLHPGR